METKVKQNGTVKRQNATVKKEVQKKLTEKAIGKTLASVKDKEQSYLRDSRNLEFKTTNTNLIKLVTTHLQSTLEQRKSEIEEQIVQFEL